MMTLYPDPALETRYERELRVTVDRERARYSAWYELFPRSTSSEPGKHGTFRDVEKRLDYVAGLGFDVLYLPPIHPIGHSFRKGKNNSVTAEDGDAGSPWAIGSKEGGHTAIHPQLGTLEDFRHLLSAVADKGMELAHGHRLPVLAGSSLGAASIRNGLRSAPTEPFSTRRIRRRSTRTFIRWISRAATGRDCGTVCATSSSTGWSRACASSAWTILTPRPFRSGSGRLAS